MKRQIFIGVMIVFILFTTACKDNGKSINQEVKPTTYAGKNNINQELKPITYASEKLINLRLEIDPKEPSAIDIMIEPEEQEKINENIVYFDKPNSTDVALAFRPTLKKEDYKKFKNLGIVIEVSGKIYKSLNGENDDNFETLNSDGTVSMMYFLIAVNDQIGKAIKEAERSNGSITINNILTTIEDGKPQGGFNFVDGKAVEWGLIYNKYEDYIKAKDWSEPEKFKQFFDKKYYFSKKS